MPRTFAVDTNAVIYYTGREPETIEVLEPLLFSDNTIIVPSIVITELWSGKRTQDAELEQVEAFLNTTFVIPLDIPIAKSAGLLRRDYNLSIGDSIIAATSRATNATLLTRNIRDFKRVPGLSLLRV